MVEFFCVRGSESCLGIRWSFLSKPQNNNMERFSFKPDWHSVVILPAEADLTELILLFHNKSIRVPLNTQGALSYFIIFTWTPVPHCRLNTVVKIITEYYHKAKKQNS